VDPTDVIVRQVIGGVEVDGALQFRERVLDGALIERIDPGGHRRDRAVAGGGRIGGRRLRVRGRSPEHDRQHDAA
jgi:hypothetical protein